MDVNEVFGAIIFGLIRKWGQYNQKPRVCALTPVRVQSVPHLSV